MIKSKEETKTKFQIPNWSDTISPNLFLIDSKLSHGFLCLASKCKCPLIGNLKGDGGSSVQIKKKSKIKIEQKR